jgi:hypothetical protein
MAAHQLMAVSAHTESDDGWQPPEGCEVVSQWVVKATARPQSAAPLTRAGVYVFRDFWLPFEHLDEAVALSSAAWQTFEGAEAYSAEPMGIVRSCTGDARIAGVQAPSVDVVPRFHLLGNIAPI